MNKEQAIKKVADLEKELELLKNIINEPENVRWKPGHFEEYYVISSDGELINPMWGNTSSGNFRYASGNCFKTEAEAIEYKEKLLFNQEVLDFIAKENGDWEVDWNDFNQKKYLLGLNNMRNNVIVDNYTYYRVTSLNKYFKSREIGEKILAKFDNEKLKKWFI